MNHDDQFFMREALEEAKIAGAKNEVPVGAVLVFDKKIIARAHNFVEKESDASRHAELRCLQKGAEIFNNWRLINTTLYSTLEPCAMCAGALILFRVGRLVYGAPDLRHGASGSVFDVLNRPHPIHQIEVCSGVCAQEAKELLQKFFRQRRTHV